MDLTDVRRHHLSLVLETLVREGAQSRARLAQRVGLTKATVSALVADLLDRGLVEEQEARRSGTVGRPGIDVAPAAGSVGALGLQIDVDAVAGCFVDLSGEVRFRKRRAVQNAGARPQVVLGRVDEVARSLMGEVDTRGMRCIGGAIAIPGLVDPTTREILVAPNLGWHDVDLRKHSANAALYVAVDNEANLAAQGELRYGAASDLRSFVYVSGGAGVGGAVVLDRELVHGVHGWAGELGHITVDPRGPQCACGAKGCLEVYVGAGHAPSPAKAARALATALRPVVHLLDPQAVILGGTLAESPETAERLHALLDAETLGGRRHACEVRRSQLGDDAAIIGAASTVLGAVVADPTIVALVPRGSPARSQESA
jgi:predicted NBD/HSP70 family sugar kinase/predicted transcriptional regulator